MNGTAEIRRNEWATQVSDVRISYCNTASCEDETLAALAHRYRERGFLRAAKEHGKEMDAMKEEARACAPEHYRWDELCANGRGDRFRNATYLGRQVMDVDGFAAYFSECRASRRAEKDDVDVLTAETVVPARTRAESRVARATGRSLVALDLTNKPESMQPIAPLPLPKNGCVRMIPHCAASEKSSVCPYRLFRCWLLLLFR